MDPTLNYDLNWMDFRFYSPYRKKSVLPSKKFEFIFFVFLHTTIFHDNFYHKIIEFSVLFSIFTSLLYQNFECHCRLESDMRAFCQPVPVADQSEKRWIIYLIILLSGIIVSTFAYFAPTDLPIRISGRVFYRILCLIAHFFGDYRVCNYAKSTVLRSRVGYLVKYI